MLVTYRCACGKRSAHASGPRCHAVLVDVATGEAPAASPEKGGGWMVKWPPPAAHLQTQQVFETESEAHHWVRMNVAEWTRDIGYKVCPVPTEPSVFHDIMEDCCTENVLEEMELGLCAHGEPTVTTELIRGWFENPEILALKEMLRKMHPSRAEPILNRQELHATRWSMLAAIVARAKLDANHAGDSAHTEVFDEFLGMMAQVEKDIPAPTPNSETEEVGYEVKHLEPLRCQEYEDEIRALREALEEALPFVAVATSHPAITHPEGIKNAEAALSKIRTALARGEK